MNVWYTKMAEKAILSMDFKTKQRIKKGIESIPAGDIKTLQGYQGLYRLRVGKWRIIFSYPNDNTILGRVGKPRQRALTAILPTELRQKKLDVA